MADSQQGGDHGNWTWELPETLQVLRTATGAQIKDQVIFYIFHQDLLSLLGEDRAFIGAQPPLSKRLWGGRSRYGGRNNFLISVIIVRLSNIYIAHVYI